MICLRLDPGKEVVERERGRNLGLTTPFIEGEPLCKKALSNVYSYHTTCNVSSVGVSSSWIEVDGHNPQFLNAGRGFIIKCDGSSGYSVYLSHSTLRKEHHGNQF